MPKIVALSDLHGYLPEIPECDLLLLAGDYNPYSLVKQQAEWMNGPFRAWLNRIPAKQVIATAGNHDFILQTQRDRALLDPLRWTLLIDEAIAWNGLTIHGIPWTPPFYKWAFMAEPDRLRYYASLINPTTDIVLAHGPVINVLDRNGAGEHCGSEVVWERMMRVRPRLYLHGHIHESKGFKRVQWAEGSTMFINCAYVNGSYAPVHDPVDVTEFL